MMQAWVAPATTAVTPSVGDGDGFRDTLVVTDGVELRLVERVVDEVTEGVGDPLFETEAVVDGATEVEPDRVGVNEAVNEIDGVPDGVPVRLGDIVAVLDGENPGKTTYGTSAGDCWSTWLPIPNSPLEPLPQHFNWLFVFTAQV